MDQVYVVRHKVKVEGLSAREVARQFGISRNTVRRYVEGAAVPGRRQERPGGPQARLDVLRQRLGALLEESPRWTGGKQRLTATQLHRMVVGEGHEVGVTLVKEFVAEWKRQRQEVFASGDVSNPANWGRVKTGQWPGPETRFASIPPSPPGATCDACASSSRRGLVGQVVRLRRGAGGQREPGIRRSLGVAGSSDARVRETLLDPKSAGTTAKGSSTSALCPS